MQGIFSLCLENQVRTSYYMLTRCTTSSNEDRLRVLEADPTFIEGEPFIITPWFPYFNGAREPVMSIPIWT